MPSKRLVAGVLLDVAEHLGVGLATEKRHRRAAWRRRSASRARGSCRSRHRRGRPPRAQPRNAATAIQKSNRVTRYRRRSSGMSIIPNTTASMMIAASTAFGSSENSGASTTSVAENERTCDEGRHRCARPGRLVERAGREAGRHRHSLEHAGSDVRHPLRDRLLIDVDAIPMPGRKRPRITRGLREADQQQRHRRDHDHREVVADDVVVREHPAPAARAGRRRRARRRGAQVEERRCQESADDQHERARNRGHA